MLLSLPIFFAFWWWRLTNHLSGIRIHSSDWHMLGDDVLSSHKLTFENSMRRRLCCLKSTSSSCSLLQHTNTRGRNHLHPFDVSLCSGRSSFKLTTLGISFSILFTNPPLTSSKQIVSGPSPQLLLTEPSNSSKALPRIPSVLPTMFA